MVWQRFRDDSNVRRRYSTDQPRVTMPNVDRYLVITAKRNRRSTASDLSWQLSSATGTTVSRQTVYRRLEQIGLYARRFVKCVALSATHYRLRPNLSVRHSGTTCTFVSGAIGDEFLFMDDKSHRHRANIVNECLQSKDITRVDWPAFSPDLNPVEHVSDMLGRRVAAHQPLPIGLPDLRRALLDEWCNIRCGSFEAQSRHVGGVWKFGEGGSSSDVILLFCPSSKCIIDADSDDESEMNKAAHVPTSSEMRNIRKSMRIYLEAHSNGEMNNKRDEIEKFVTKKTMQRKISHYFPKIQ
ncbi:transposable element Tcb1 transposase [Trichonephila clavipes]|nr:transposable element Tcb1 transposase [Trichonephila clavipes]